MNTISSVPTIQVPVKWPELRLKLTRLLTMQEGVDLRRTRFEWVYVVQAESDPALIKIGRAYRISRRLGALQRSCPVPLKVLALVIAPRGTESALHAVWDDLRVYSEWFYPDRKLTDAVKLLPKAKRIDVPELLAFCKSRGLGKAALREHLYWGAKRKNRRRFRAAKKVCA